MVSTTVRRTLSPKRPDAERIGLADVFPYYAGFSYLWAQQHVRDLLDGRDDEHVVDPWNGSGTTTLAAASLGVRSTGVDLNPATIHVARIRSLTRSQIDQLSHGDLNLDASLEKDPLAHWFTERTTRRLRGWAAACEAMDSESSSLHLVTLFRVVRSLTSTFVGTNPTWVKVAATPGQLVDLDDSELDALIRAERINVLARLTIGTLALLSPDLRLSNTKDMPIKSGSATVIVTSPPYLTRIDYAVAYSRELAILGIDVFADRTLRSALMGSTLARPKVEPLLGGVASTLVDRVSTHPSKASSGYYSKQLTQYLDDLSSSLDEVTRIAADRAVMTLVVQDSYYKEILIPLADIIVDECQIRGWGVANISQFPVRRLLTKLNTNANEHAKGKVHESVITFRRAQ